MEFTTINNLRYAVQDPLHYDMELWSDNTIKIIQDEVAKRLEAHNDVKKYVIVAEEQIKNVMDSVTQSNPHKGRNEVIEMIISFITNSIANEYYISKRTYDSRAVNYDGSFGIQRLPTGQLGIKKKGLNSIGRMF
jgi:hypothetical protein